MDSFDDFQSEEFISSSELARLEEEIQLKEKELTRINILQEQYGQQYSELEPILQEYNLELSLDPVQAAEVLQGLITNLKKEIEENLEVINELFKSAN